MEFCTDVDVKRAVSKEEMELVKGVDGSGQHLGGLPPGLGMGAQGVLGGLGAGLVSQNLFARAGQGVGAWPGVDRNLAELLMLQQELSGNGAVNQAAGLADLLAGLNLQQSAQRYGDGDLSNGQNSASVAAVQELFRQQALMNAGNLRQAGLGMEFHHTPVGWMMAISPSHARIPNRRIIPACRIIHADHAIIVLTLT